MKKLKILPKMFIQIFSVLVLLIMIIHLLVFFMFPKSYLETRKHELTVKADEIAEHLDGKDLNYITQSLEFFSSSNDIKAFIKKGVNANELAIDEGIDVNLNSNTNSLIVEERAIHSNSGSELMINFVSTADMLKEAKSISFKFLPLSLIFSIAVSILIAFIYAKMIKRNVSEIKEVTDQMMQLDRQAYLEVNSADEIAELKLQINELYRSLLSSIDDIEVKNKEIIKLEQMKYDFLRGSSHELKTPLSRMKIILENMKYNIGKYKDRDLYIDKCLDITNELTYNISQILTFSSLEYLKDDEEWVTIKSVLDAVLVKYDELAMRNHLTFNSTVHSEQLLISKKALNLVLSNLISNAVKYSEPNTVISIDVKNDWLCVANVTHSEVDLKPLMDIKFDLNKEDSHGLGLYIIKTLLKNYGIDYAVENNERMFVFKIKLMSRG
ncbi:sensor histidine kinase [Globicatella sanguinis]|uniref:sensor histidine kinase n=1 Tax=Globicatella sanguinis TaxID=13076 RepID=UPI002543FAAB|nr:HAMP domain-containing sensor histidine kinase [Globicatella sanguinis]MDK7631124.1 HAMP domain-containing sensor histidine kinase [Globicatella sanguinis]WIK67093.1 HAMP domain-containing sensor histidine kinase [Globicatella sanguinis]WKT56498.1 HAMP domain-containing sensor histidine kinase [Globicatella sanguinis]